MNYIPVVVTQERVSPEQARALLMNLNATNRPVDPSHVKRLATAIREGRFEVTGQTIAIDEDGRLADGQHRLHAIVAADMAVWLNVARGVPRDAFKYTDNGRPRSLRDTARIPAAQAAVVKKLTALAFAASEIERHHELTVLATFTDKIAQVLAISPESSRNFPAPVIRAAAVVQLQAGMPADHIAQVYKMLATGNMEGEVSPLVGSLFQLAIRGRLDDKTQRRYLFARAMAAFDPSKAQQQAGRITADAMNAAKRRAQEVLRSALGMPLPEVTTKAPRRGRVAKKPAPQPAATV